MRRWTRAAPASGRPPPAQRGHFGCNQLLSNPLPPHHHQALGGRPADPGHKQQTHQRSLLTRPSVAHMKGARHARSPGPYAWAYAHQGGGLECLAAATAARPHRWRPRTPMTGPRCRDVAEVIFVMVRPLARPCARQDTACHGPSFTRVAISASTVQRRRRLRACR